jgi:gamma-glutamyltranspeptidase / glutathione hydrolase
MSNTIRHFLYITLAFVLFSACKTTQPSTSSFITFPYKIEKEVVSKNGMIVTAHPLATKVGVDILKKGGNAVDAAIAVQFTLAVVYPQAGNIGGGGFLVYRGKNGEVSTLDFREKAPAKAFETMYLDKNNNVIEDLSVYGGLACGVPGSVDGMWEAHKKYGSMRWADLLQPAIEFAGKGFQITANEAENLNEEQQAFIKNSSTRTAFIAGSTGWKTGEWLIQKDLQNSLSRIAGQGRNGFYEGATAALILREMSEKQGIITADDLKNYHSVWRKPLEFDHKDLHIITMPPPSSGGIILAQCLKMIEQNKGIEKGFHSTESVHIMAEAERRAFSDRAEHLGDPDFWNVPQSNLVSDNYMKDRMATFSPSKATPSAEIKPGNFHQSEQTTHFSIVDAMGNAVSLTTTLNDSYGSRCVVGGAGFILNNEMDDFSAKPGTQNLYGAIGGKANAIVPFKRPLSSMTPTIVLRNDKLWMVIGTPGGTTIPTSVFQVIVNVWKYKMTLMEAVQAKRFHHQCIPDRIAIEKGTLPEQTVEALQKMGHKVEDRGAIGRVEAILIRPDGKMEGVADERGDDCAGGF